MPPAAGWGFRGVAPRVRLPVLFLGVVAMVRLGSHLRGHLLHNFAPQARWLLGLVCLIIPYSVVKSADPASDPTSSSSSPTTSAGPTSAATAASTTRRRTSTGWPRRGMRFTSGYTCGPNCQPTRAALMSGQYGPRTGVYTVGGIDRFDWQSRPLRPVDNVTELPLDKITIAAGAQGGRLRHRHVRQVAPRPAGASIIPASAASTRRSSSMGKHFDFDTQPAGRLSRRARTWPTSSPTRPSTSSAGTRTSRSSSTCRTSPSTRRTRPRRS